MENLNDFIQAIEPVIGVLRKGVTENNVNQVQIRTNQLTAQPGRLGNMILIETLVEQENMSTYQLGNAVGYAAGIVMGWLGHWCGATNKNEIPTVLRMPIDENIEAHRRFYAQCLDMPDAKASSYRSTPIVADKGRYGYVQSFMEYSPKGFRVVMSFVYDETTDAVTTAFLTHIAGGIQTPLN